MDPALGQWWYTPQTQERLARRILEERGARDKFRILTVGAPTVAPLLSKAGCDVHVADVDPDTIEAVKDVCPSAELHLCDLLITPLKIDPVDVAIVDPPWYAAEMKAFLRQALTNLSVGGKLIVSLPPLLTRPKIIEERRALLHALRSHGADTLFLDRNIVKYVVPPFEVSAFRDVVGFSGQPWRVADLLLCVKSREQVWELDPSEAKRGAMTVERFSRARAEFRVFLGGMTTGSAAPRTTIVELKNFSDNVSRRAHGDIFPDLWTSEKTGAQVEDIEEARAVLSCWIHGHDKEATKRLLAEKRKVVLGTSAEIVEKYDTVLGIWSRFREGIGRRLPEEIQEKKKSVASRWAVSPSQREHGDSSDGFRLAFPRDRDRITWSGSFRNLAGKTQPFPVDRDDQLRQRLTHSIEVTQLAGTIADSFGLDRDLVEAGALAHDIGHTPFGHAGEHALDRILLEIAPSANSPGFNHYEHGVDVVRYLEAPYQYLPQYAHMGLNLTPEVCECIFKHTYCQAGNRVSHDEIRRRSKHSDFLRPGYCHLEGQAVRIADKVSYLMSDIEDGIRLEAVDERALMDCNLFHRPPIDLSQPKGEPLLRRFLLQRRNVLRILMEDIITHTGRELARLGNREDVQGQRRYVINHSDRLAADVDEVWRKLQAGRLHKNPRVIQSNMKAAKIVSELFFLMALFPELVAEPFRREHARLTDSDYVTFYKRSLGNAARIDAKLIQFLPLDRYIGLPQEQRDSREVPVYFLIMAKDYVASLSDSQARILHAEYLG